LSAQSNELRIAIAAPTGKASMRMKASLESAAQQFDVSVQSIMQNLQPYTIHRLLQYQFNSVNFKYNKQNTLPLDVLIVDEASMIDFALMTKLLEALPLSCRVIFLGDANQLASVEAGSLFGDLCKSVAQGTTVSQSLYDWYQTHLSEQFGSLPSSVLPQQPHLLNGHIIQLIKSHRFKSDSGIAQMAKWVIDQSQSDLEQFTQTADQQVYLEPDLSEAIKAYTAALYQYIEEPNTYLALQKFQSLRLLAVTREGSKGLKQLNKQIELSLSKQSSLNAQSEFYSNRPVMITKNHPELGLFNGDIGIVRPDDNGVMKIWFESGDQTVKGFMPGLFANCETVFAMTVHKSQGSEFDYVWVVLPESGADQLMTSELLYTAVTRGKKSVCIQASRTQLLAAIQRRVKRSSGIINRLSWA
jgi:exodeoxyribonuclease V alpha subunit